MSFSEASLSITWHTKCIAKLRKLIKIGICFIFHINVKSTYDNNIVIFAKLFLLRRLDRSPKKVSMFELHEGLYALKIALLLF